MSVSRRRSRRGVVAVMVTAVVTSLGVAAPRAYAVTVPVLGAWTGSLNWSEDFSGAAGSAQGNYCGTTVTDSVGIVWSENISVSPFSFTLAENGYVSTPTGVNGSVTFTVTYDVPQTTNGAQTCPAEIQSTSGTFSGSGMTTVSGEIETGQNTGPYLELVDWAAGGFGTGGWTGTLTQIDPDIDSGAPQVNNDLLWLPHIALDVAIGTDDAGTWGGMLPGTNFFQKNNNTSDAFVTSGYSIFYYGTPAYYGLFGSANARVTGPSTAPPVIKAPVTTITKAPKPKTTATKATFRFTSNQTHSTFRCYLDKAKAKPCTSPKTYTHLARGKHAMHVYAVNQSGKKDLTPAHWSWKIVKKK
jgi:hypothetical protein